MKTVHPSPLLTFALRLDALLSAGLAVLQVALAHEVDTLLALPAALLWGSGIFMGVYALSVWWLASRSRHAALWVMVIVVGNLLWAVACLLLPTVAGLTPTGPGWGLLLVHSAGVTTFALLQWTGLKRSPPDLQATAPRHVAKAGVSAGSSAGSAT